MKFKTVSIAAHTTWNYCKDYNFLIDAGEGVAAHNGIGAMTALDNILLTHDHWDHIAGLLMLLHLRKRIGTAHGRKPLTIWFPYWSDRLNTICKLAPGVEWTLVRPGDKIELGINNRSPVWATPFPVRHASGRAVGYKIFHSRKQRNPIYSLKTNEEMHAMARAGVDNLAVNWDHHLLTYTGDTMPIPADQLGIPKMLIHEATYHAHDVQDKHEHSVLQEAISASAMIGSGLVVNHLSLRYLHDGWETMEKYFPEGVRWIAPTNRVQEIVVPD